MLALELLKILLENSGPLFRSSERFVSAIKQYLCLSLLKNCQSAVPASLRLCCSIFLTLMTKFRKNLKAEIGVFFPMILLRPIKPAVMGATPNAAGAPPRLSSRGGWRPGTLRRQPGAAAPTLHALPDPSLRLSLVPGLSSRPLLPPPAAPAGAGGAATAPVDIAHKAVVLRCLQAQCEDGQLLVDLFVNYDCDLEGANLFERMVTALVRIAQGSLAHDAGAGAAAPLEEQAIRYEVGGWVWWVGVMLAARALAGPCLFWGRAS